MTHPLAWKKYHPLSDQNAFICLVDHMGDDSSIVQAARVSYGKDEQGNTLSDRDNNAEVWEKQIRADRQLIRYLMNHSHTTPFEMVEIKFMVQVPMDCWRQWIRHRTASVNEYSTRYTEALDFFQVTDPSEWRLQSSDNKQGSSGYLEEWPNGWYLTLSEEDNKSYQRTNGTVSVFVDNPDTTPGEVLTELESITNSITQDKYQLRIALGIAKEQARKDLPLSTYTRAYWKCDLHNIFNFLRLRMDSHAQFEIRSFANCMFEIVKQLCPVACEAFEDYVLHAKKFSRMETRLLKLLVEEKQRYEQALGIPPSLLLQAKPDSMTDREWKAFLEKLSCPK